MQTKSSSEARPSQTFVIPRSQGDWLRRWWPALVPAGFSLVCAVVFAVQQVEIRDLRQSVRTLSEQSEVERSRASTLPLRADEKTAQALAMEEQEVNRLKGLVTQLTADIARLEQMRSENQSLRAQLSASGTGLTPEETAAMEKARERAEAIQCVNNLKQLGLAARIWAGDNADIYPPDVVCMSNEMNTPKILVCPGDHGRQVAADFGSFTEANCSYEWFLSPRGSDAEPTRVLNRCPVHGTVGLYDGSVQMGAAKNHPEWFVQRDGKLFMEPPPSPPAANTPNSQP